MAARIRDLKAEGELHSTFPPPEAGDEPQKKPRMHRRRGSLDNGRFRELARPVMAGLSEILSRPPKVVSRAQHLTNKVLDGQKQPSPPIRPPLMSGGGSGCRGGRRGSLDSSLLPSPPPTRPMTSSAAAGPMPAGPVGRRNKHRRGSLDANMPQDWAVAGGRGTLAGSNPGIGLDPEVRAPKGDRRRRASLPGQMTRHEELLLGGQVKTFCIPCYTHTVLDMCSYTYI